MIMEDWKLGIRKADERIHSSTLWRIQAVMIQQLI